MHSDVGKLPIFLYVWLLLLLAQRLLIAQLFPALSAFRIQTREKVEMTLGWMTFKRSSRRQTYNSIHFTNLHLAPE